MLLHSKWISYTTGMFRDANEKYGNPSPYFRRTFTTAEVVKKATLSIAALGVYKVYINGEEVSDDYLSPPWVDYTKKIPLLEYDITDKIIRKNAIGIVLGDGWAVGHIGSTSTFKRNSYNDTVQFCAEINIEYVNGLHESVMTDKTWRANTGEILYSDIYMGEYIDRRKSLGNYSMFDYDDSQWQWAVEDEFKFSRNIYLDRVDIPPIRVKHIMEPVHVSTENNKLIYDVGQNIAGVLRCVFKGESSAKIIVRHGEILDNGKLYIENLRKAEAMDTFVLSGIGEEVFRPIFTYHGFRYFEFEVIGNVDILDVKAEVMYTDLEVSGGFSCSSELVNKIYQNILWSQRDNFYSVPTDCPQRDERLGWTGDAQVFCQSAVYNMNCKKYYEKYLGDIRDAQLGNGVIPCVAPLPHVGFHSYTGYDASAGWSEAIVIIPYVHYKMYGDKQIIKDNIFAAKRLLRYYEYDSRDYIRYGKDGMYGDWLNVDSVTDLDVVATLYFAHAADLLAQLCCIIHDDDEKYYAKLYDNIKNAFRKKYVSFEGVIFSDTQSAYAMAYKFGIISKNEAKVNLERKLKESDGHLTTGFLGIQCLLPVLCDIGLCDNAYDILTQTTFPSWGYSVINGATTMWEHWNSNSQEELTAMNSFNHYSLGSCVEWMYEYCLGLCPIPAIGGLKKIKLKPYIDLSGKLTFAEGYYNSPLGKISLRWSKERDAYKYEVIIPGEIDVEFEFPGLEMISKIRQRDKITILLKRVKN